MEFKSGFASRMSMARLPASSDEEESIPSTQTKFSTGSRGVSERSLRLERTVSRIKQSETPSVRGAGEHSRERSPTSSATPSSPRLSKSVDGKGVKRSHKPEVDSGEASAESDDDEVRPSRRKVLKHKASDSHDEGKKVKEEGKKLTKAEKEKLDRLQAEWLKRCKAMKWKKSEWGQRKQRHELRREIGFDFSSSGSDEEGPAQNVFQQMKADKETPSDAEEKYEEDTLDMVGDEGLKRNMSPEEWKEFQQAQDLAARLEARDDQLFSLPLITSDGVHLTVGGPPVDSGADLVAATEDSKTRAVRRAKLARDNLILAQRYRALVSVTPLLIVDCAPLFSCSR